MFYNATRAALRPGGLGALAGTIDNVRNLWRVRVIWERQLANTKAHNAAQPKPFPDVNSGIPEMPAELATGNLVNRAAVLNAQITALKNQQAVALEQGKAIAAARQKQAAQIAQAKAAQAQQIAAAQAKLAAQHGIAEMWRQVTVWRRHVANKQAQIHGKPVPFPQPDQDIPPVDASTVTAEGLMRELQRLKAQHASMKQPAPPPPPPTKSIVVATPAGPILTVAEPSVWDRRKRDKPRRVDTMYPSVTAFEAQAVIPTSGGNPHGGGQSTAGAGASVAMSIESRLHGEPNGIALILGSGSTVATAARAMSFANIGASL